MTPEEKAKQKVSWNDVKEKYLKFHRMDKFTEYMAIDIDFGYWLANEVIKEALRWRDPITEKPEIFETVFVKAEKRWEGRSTETFYTTSSRVGSLIFECEGSKKMYDGSYSQVEVIGWRPI